MLLNMRVIRLRLCALAVVYLRDFAFCGPNQQHPDFPLNTDLGAGVDVCHDVALGFLLRMVLCALFMYMPDTETDPQHACNRRSLPWHALPAPICMQYGIGLWTSPLEGDPAGSIGSRRIGTLQCGPAIR